MNHAVLVRLSKASENINLGGSYGEKQHLIDPIQPPKHTPTKMTPSGLAILIGAGPATVSFMAIAPSQYMPLMG